MVVQKNEQRDFRRTINIQCNNGNVNSIFSDSVILQLSFTCDYFLYRMVRRLVGLIVNICLGLVSLNDVERIMQHFDNLSTTENLELQKKGAKCIREQLFFCVDAATQLTLSSLLFTAPAKGLFLSEVLY